MKFIIIFISVLASCTFVSAQTPDKGSYVQNANLDKFVGTWEARLDDKTIRLQLKKEEKVYIKALDFYMDLLIGWHEFKAGTKVVESSMQHEGKNYDDKTTIVAGSNGEGQITITTFKDLSRDRNLEGTFLLNSDGNIILNLRFSEDVRINKPAPKPAIAIPVPSEWTFTKVN